ncbi:MAG: hypothetical protein ABH865_01705 [Candidatus Omnitrophota bacterium]
MKKLYFLLGVIVVGIFFNVPTTYGEGFLDKTIDYLKNKRIDALEQQARSVVRIIIRGIEGYTDDHGGACPQSVEELTKGNPPYLTPGILSLATEKYIYSIESGQNSCKVLRVPKECGKTGNLIFSMEIMKGENPCGAGIQPLKRSEMMAQMDLSMFSSVIDEYISNNNGAYPLEENNLKQALDVSKFPGSDRIFDDNGKGGYTYTVEYRSNGYKITALPTECGKTGTRIFTEEIVELIQQCKQ